MKSSELTPFQAAIATVIQMIPPGRVMSYGQVALYVGAPRGAQLVGWMLRGMETKVSIPWWRVINNAGRITIKGNRYNTPQIQKQLLETEGIKINDEFILDIKQYRYIPTEDEIKSMNLSEIYLNKIHEKGFL